MCCAYEYDNKGKNTVTAHRIRIYACAVHVAAFFSSSFSPLVARRFFARPICVASYHHQMDLRCLLNARIQRTVCYAVQGCTNLNISRLRCASLCVCAWCVVRACVPKKKSEIIIKKKNHPPNRIWNRRRAIKICYLYFSDFSWFIYFSARPQSGKSSANMNLCGRWDADDKSQWFECMLAFTMGQRVNDELLFFSPRASWTSDQQAIWIRISVCWYASLRRELSANCFPTAIK